MEPHPYLESYWQYVAAQKGMASFLQGYGSWEATHAPANGPIPKYTLSASTKET